MDHYRSAEDEAQEFPPRLIAIAIVSSDGGCISHILAPGDATDVNVTFHTGERTLVYGVLMTEAKALALAERIKAAVEQLPHDDRSFLARLRRSNFLKTLKDAVIFR